MKDPEVTATSSEHLTAVTGLYSLPLLADRCLLSRISAAAADIRDGYGDGRGHGKPDTSHYACKAALVQDRVSASDQGRRQGAANSDSNQSSATVAVFSDSVQSRRLVELHSRRWIEQPPGHRSDLIEGVHSVTGT